MRRKWRIEGAAHLGLIALGLALSPPVLARAPGAVAAQARVPISVRRYVEKVLTILRAEALHRRQIDFAALEARIWASLGPKSSLADTHAAIKAALPLLDDHHSGFFSFDEIHKMLGFSHADLAEVAKGRAPHARPEDMATIEAGIEFATGEVREGHIGYLKVPSVDTLFAEGMAVFAERLHARIAAMEAAGVDGWVVDLRGNVGGNLMPMALGLGPLLDAGNVFYSVDLDGKVRDRALYRDGGYYGADTGEPDGEALLQLAAPYRLKRPDAPIAVLTDGRTASSAEAIVAMFKGQPRVAVIGKHSNGLTSANSFHVLADDAVLNLTVGFDADRNRNVYRQGIPPDIAVDASEGGADPVFARAAEFIRDTKRPPN